MSPDDFRRLVSAGLSTDQIAIVMEMFAERDEARKASQRARWRKHQENKKNANVSKRELTIANVPRGGDARVEDKTSTQKIEPQKKDITPQAALETVLDSERAKAVVDHRQRIRKPLTTHGARLLAGKFGKCADANAAADTMVSNGWQGFEPEWLDRQQARGSPPPRLDPVTEAANRLMAKMEAADASSAAKIESDYPAPFRLSATG